MQKIVNNGLKLDLHIHAKKTDSDSPFEFSLDKLKEYVEKMGNMNTSIKMLWAKEKQCIAGN